MNKRRYRISADIKTLAKFFKNAASLEIGDAFLSRLSVSTGEEYYYIYLLATMQVHKTLDRAGFTDSETVWDGVKL